MHELLPYPAIGDVWISDPTGHSQSRSGIRVHRTRTLRAGDAGHMDGVPITGPARTLLDIAPVVESYRLEAALAEARVLKLVTEADIHEQLRRNPGRRGTRRLRRLLESEMGPAYTRSEAERRMLALIRSMGLPEPEVNGRVGQYTVDFLWRERKLAAEYDSWEFHSHPRAFKRDREKTNELQLMGLAVLRFTGYHLTRGRRAFRSRLRQAIGITE